MCLETLPGKINRIYTVRKYAVIKPKISGHFFLLRVKNTSFLQTVELKIRSTNGWSVCRTETNT